MRVRRWTCPWAQNSFGLRESDKKYIYEELFILVEHCGIRYTEAWEMPIEIRKWWIERKSKENEDKNSNGSAPAPRAPFNQVMKK